jgi:hypothetical protein
MGEGGSTAPTRQTVEARHGDYDGCHTLESAEIDQSQSDIVRRIKIAT